MYNCGNLILFLSDDVIEGLMKNKRGKTHLYNRSLIYFLFNALIFKLIIVKRFLISETIY